MTRSQTTSNGASRWKKHLAKHPPALLHCACDPIMESQQHWFLKSLKDRTRRCVSATSTEEDSLKKPGSPWGSEEHPSNEVRSLLSYLQKPNLRKGEGLRMRMYPWIHTCRGQKSTPWAILWDSSTFPLFETDSHFNSSSPISLSSQRDLGITSNLFFPFSFLLMWVLEIKLGSPHFHRKHFANWINSLM